MRLFSLKCPPAAVRFNQGYPLIRIPDRLVLCPLPDTRKPFSWALLGASIAHDVAAAGARIDAGHTTRNGRILDTQQDVKLPADEAVTWARILNRYRDPSVTRSIIELVITALPLAALWVAMWAALEYLGFWASLVLAIPAAGFLVRLFMIQHDCGHGSFFRAKPANDWVGRVIGILTMTPYDFWRRTHTVHHATSGNLDRRGMGDIDTLTVEEYLARSRWGRLQYRAYRHPIVMFGIGPAYLFLIQHRLPVGLMRAGWLPWISTMATNAAIALIAATLIWFIGVWSFLLVHLPIMVFAASIGVWLFYVQHQFEHTSWNEGDDWNLQEAALHGSSHYDLPHVLRWFTANIGIHHVHHLCSRIPYYRLTGVLRDHPELGKIGRLTLLESIWCVRLVLWDENRRRLISFRELRLATAAA
jgi:omega-6 fatty acid desaturase (delta-12 desaturase)